MNLPLLNTGTGSQSMPVVSSLQIKIWTEYFLCSKHYALQSYKSLQYILRSFEVVAVIRTNFGPFVIFRTNFYAKKKRRLGRCLSWQKKSRTWVIFSIKHKPCFFASSELTSFWITWLPLGLSPEDFQIYHSCM